MAPQVPIAAARGLVFPSSGSDGARSTAALGRAVVADALRAVDPVGARAAEGETNWRRGYVGHFRRVLEAGLTSRDAAETIAVDGLASLHARMRFVRPDGEEVALADVFADPSGTLVTETVDGGGTPERDVSVPYRGQRLSGDALRRQLDVWVAAGVIEPTCASAVGDVIENPDWLDLSDRRIVVLGAGAEMGPVHALLRWGADVVAVDLPRPQIWTRLLELNARYGGRLRVPSRPGSSPLSERAGADLVHDLPHVASWLLGQVGPLVLGNYVYADGATNARVSMAVDVLSAHIVAERPDTALAFLATPTDVFAVPADAVEQSGRAYAQPSGVGRLRGPLKAISAGRMLRRNYAPGSDPGICDSLVPQQGPNYALAKRLQRWRATAARSAGTTVSFKVAPPTRTRSVLKNRALAAAYAGAHRFGVEAFEPATSNSLMAILLVHDLRSPSAVAPREHPWMDEAYAAAHGGLWRAPYAPRSALGLAALLGIGGARA
jgi:hypothetical protein